MKNLVLFAVLAAVAVHINAAVVVPVDVEESVAVFELEGDVPEALAAPRTAEESEIEPIEANEPSVFESGDISARNRLLFSNTYRRNAIANAVQVQTVRITFAANIRISSVRVAEVGASQNAMAHIIDGGVNRNFVVIRFTSARGRGFNFSVQIYGR